MRYRHCVTTARVPADPPAATRFGRLDALRGVAMVWMATYHFAYDLNFFRLVRIRLSTDPVWTVQRLCIVALFLLCAGAGQALALRHASQAPLCERFDPRFWRRWAQVAGCALLVSAVSYAMFPRTFISFGVLHAVAAMLIVVRLSAGTGPALWGLGLAALLLPHLVASPFFDSRWTNWLGFTTQRPPTVDYVPLLPWIGAMWWGVAAATWALRQQPGWLEGPLPVPLVPLAALGRWPLSFYMLHQPLLMGGLQLWMRLHR